MRLVKRGGKSKAAAERALRAALADREAPTRQAAVTPASTFSAVADLWLVEVEHAVDERVKSPGTLDAYRSVYRRHVKPALGALRVREVDTPVVDRMLAAIKKRTVNGARTARSVVSGVMRFAARHGAVTVNPVREVARIEAPPKNEPRSLSAEERQHDVATRKISDQLGHSKVSMTQDRYLVVCLPNG